MFKKVTEFIVNQVDPSKELVPVESIADHEHFRPFCLLIRKRKPDTIFHSRHYYQPTGFRLDDVLLPGEDGKSTELKGGESFSKEFSIKLQKKVRSLESLEAVRRKRQINMDHSFIRQFQRSNFKLYVVYETLETSEEAIYKESIKADRSIKAKIHGTFFAQGTRDNKQGIVIPKGCTLAFKAIQLYISNGKWGLSYFPATAVRSAAYEDEELSSDLLVMLLNTITAVMRDSNLFEELSQKMENLHEQTDGYELKTESPDLKDLLSTLEKSPRTRHFQLAEGITYTLDALAELLENQLLLLLLKSLEREIVSQQLKLVGQLLEHNLEEWNEPFRVDASLLSFPRQEEQSFTMDLVKLSGVKLQEDGSAVPVEQPFEAVAALYIALYVLMDAKGWISKWIFLSLPS